MLLIQSLNQEWSFELIYNLLSHKCSISHDLSIVLRLHSQNSHCSLSIYCLIKLSTVQKVRDIWYRLTTSSRQMITWRGYQLQREVCQPIIWQKFWWTLHEDEKNGPRGGARRCQCTVCIKVSQQTSKTSLAFTIVLTFARCKHTFNINFPTVVS